MEVWEGKKVTLNMAMYLLKRWFTEGQPDFDWSLVSKALHPGLK